MAMRVLHHRRCRAAALASLGIAAMLFAAPKIVQCSSLRLMAPPVRLNAEAALDTEDDGAAEFVAALEAALKELEPLQDQVDSGHIIPKFGEKAQAILGKAVSKAGSTGAELERAIDAKLQILFLQQLALLRQQLAAKFDRGNQPAEALAKMDMQFVSEAKDLTRPGSSWNSEPERYALRAMLEGGLRRDAALNKEQAKVAMSQQATVEVIGRLQNQMESMQERLKALRAGAPVVVSASYRIPGTPFQLIGRYQQGRANIELNLSPDRDPANAEAGFVAGIGPANVGTTINVGM